LIGNTVRPINDIQELLLLVEDKGRFGSRRFWKHLLEGSNDGTTFDAKDANEVIADIIASFLTYSMLNSQIFFIVLPQCNKRIAKEGSAAEVHPCNGYPEQFPTPSTKASE